MFMSYSGIKDLAAKNGNHGLLMEGCGLTDTLLKTYETQEYLKVTNQKPKES